MCPRSRGSDPEEVTSWGVGARQYNDNDKSSEASIIAVAEVTPKLRTALPAEVDKLLIKEEPVSLANRMVNMQARGF
jgi:hypothetical protein